MSQKELDKKVGGAIQPSATAVSTDPTQGGVEFSVDVIKARTSRAYNVPEVRGHDQAFHDILRNKANVQYGALDKRLTDVANSLHDFRPRNVVGFYQYAHHFNRYPEEEIMKRVLPLYSGKGSSQDHPDLHKLFMDSFAMHPELLMLYNRH